MLFGAISLATAHRVVVARARAAGADARAFLLELRQRYRGWGTLWLLADRATGHTDHQTQALAERLDNPLRLAADAGVRAERDGPTVARVEGCDRREPTSADDRRAGRQRPALGVDAVADRSASQSRPVVAPFLAPRFVAKLLSTYLAICTQFRSVMCVIVVWMKFCVRSGVLNKSAIWDIPEICCKRSGNPLTYRVSVDVPSPDTSTF